MDAIIKRGLLIYILWMHNVYFTDSSTQCYKTIDGSIGFGTITSPNHPDNYPHGLFCTWNITAVPGARIILRFEKFFTLCESDTVFISDGITTLLNETCGPNIEKDIGVLISSTNNVAVTFNTDSTVRSTGFNLTWNVCGGTFLATEGAIRMTQIYAPDYMMLVCSFHLIGPDNTVMQIDFSCTDFTSTDDNCMIAIRYRADGITVDGLDCSNLGLLVSTTNKIIVDLTMIPETPGFSAHFQQIECDEILRNTYGTIQSPGYPRRIGYNANCSYNFEISGAGNSMIHLMFEDIEIPCEGFEQLQVINMQSEDPITVCGGNSSTSIYIDVGSRLLFRSVKDTISIRFKADYTLVAVTGHTSTLQATPHTSPLTQSTESASSTYDGTRTQQSSVSSSTPVDSVSSTLNVPIIAGAVGGSAVVVIVIVTVIVCCFVGRRKQPQSSSRAEIDEPGQNKSELGNIGDIYSVPNKGFGEAMPPAVVTENLDLIDYNTASGKNISSKTYLGVQQKDVYAVPKKYFDNKEDIYQETTEGEYDVLHKRRQKKMDSTDDDTYDVSQRDDNPYNVTTQVSSHNIDDLYDHAKQRNADDNTYDTTTNVRKGR